MAKKEITLEKLAAIPLVKMVQTDYNRTKVGFYFDVTGRNEFYVLDPTTKEYQKKTEGHLPRAIRAGFLWLKDGKSIIYTKDKDGNEKHDLYYFNIETLEVRQLTDTPQASEFPLDISPDGKYLVFSSTRAGQLNLFKMDLDTGDIVQLTDHKAPTWGTAVWGTDGWIYYPCNETANLKNRDIWAVKEDGSEKRLVLQLSTDSQENVADITADASLLAIESDVTGISRAGIYNLKTGETKWLSDGRFEEHPIEFTKDGKKLLVLRNHEAEVYPVIYNIETGEAHEIKRPGLTFNTHFCIDDKFLIYTRSDPKTPQVFALYNIEEKKEEVIIPPQTDLTPEDYYDSEYVRYPSFDGLEIPAIIYKPKIEQGKKYPALVLVHGGPTAQYFRSFDIFGQVFAHNGFVLLLPNIRGSTGYGKEFREMNYLDWGGGDAKDVIYGKKYLESLPYVDPERIGVFGGSYGGFMTFLQMTKYADASWKAGAAWIGISHLKQFYDRSQPHFKYFINQHLGTYEENKDLWEDRSALNHIEKIKAPILIIHGVNDPRCPIEESRNFRDKLIELGKKEGEDFEYIEFADEGHGAFSDIKMRIRTFKLFLEFFLKRL